MRKKIKRFKKIKPSRMFTFSLPEDVAAELDKQPRGKKSEITAEALREYFTKRGVSQPPPEKQEVVSGLTEEEILQRVKEHVESEFNRSVDEVAAKRDEARKKGDYAGASIYSNIWINKLWVSDFLHEVTIAEIQAALGLPYMTVYNKILPILRKAGYKIVQDRGVI